MNELLTQISNFFGERIRTNPEIMKPSVLSRTMIGAELRPKVLLDVTAQDISVKTGELFSGMSGQIYRVFAQHSSVIMAHYEDGTLLWLDDHSSNDDYSVFIRRERLMDWLPEHVDKFIDLLLATKFNFLEGVMHFREG